MTTYIEQSFREVTLSQVSFEVESLKDIVPERDREHRHCRDIEHRIEVDELTDARNRVEILIVKWLVIMRRLLT